MCLLKIQKIYRQFLEIKRHPVNDTKVKNLLKHIIQIFADGKPELFGTYILLKPILLLVIGDFNIRTIVNTLSMIMVAQNLLW